MTIGISKVGFSRDLRSSALTRLKRGVAFGWLRVVALVLLDSLLLATSWQLAEALGTDAGSSWNTQENPTSLVLILFIELILIAAKGLYQAGEKRRDYLELIKTLSIAEILLLLIAFFYEPQAFISRSHFLLFWLFSVSSVCAGRYFIDSATKFIRHRGVVRYSAFLIADLEDQEKAIELIEREKRYNILGVVDSLSLDRDTREETFDKIQQLGIVEAFVSWDAIKNRLFLCWYFQTAGITLHILPIGMETIFKASKYWLIGGQPSLTFPPPVITGGDFWVKRTFDFCCALLTLTLASPIYLLIAILIKLDSPGPILYKQTRIGLHGKPFKAWKFRTMVTNADKLQKELEAFNEMQDGIMFKMKDDPRITRIGKFLRTYSLDELPQIFNVLFGEMSLVGPRPFPVRDVEKFTGRHFIRHEVLPGITGLWQVSGRSDVTDFEQVMQLDMRYIENWSLWMDLQIILKTIKVVLQKSGAY